jgi:DNA-binding MarR family transcriptional regulator
MNWKHHTKLLMKYLDQEKELTFKQLKEKLQVSDPTLTEYVKELEKEGWIEHFEKPEDRRNRWYRIPIKNKAKVQFLLDKQLLTDIVDSLDYRDVLHFLQDFTTDLISLRREADQNDKVDLKFLVKQATKSAFKLYDLGEKVK